MRQASGPGVRRGAPARDEGGYPDTTPRSAAESARRDAAVADDDSGVDDDGAAPHRTRLSSKQYEALVRCAQQVVAVSAVPPAPMPSAFNATNVVTAAPARSFNANHSYARAAEVKQQLLTDVDGRQ